MDRRTFCATTAAAVTGSLVGCVGTPTDADPEPETPTGTAPQTETPTQSPAQPHDLYVMNYTTTTETATVQVIDGGGTDIVDGRYELPSERGIEFEDVGAWQRSYTVELSVDGTDLSPLTWATESCASVDEAPRGSRNGYVQVRSDGADRLQATLAVDGCDEIIGPAYPTGPADGFRVEE